MTPRERAISLGRCTGPLDFVPVTSETRMLATQCPACGRTIALTYSGRLAGHKPPRPPKPRGRIGHPPAGERKLAHQVPVKLTSAQLEAVDRATGGAPRARAAWIRELIISELARLSSGSCTTADSSASPIDLGQ